MSERRRNYVVDGFIFHDEDLAERAAREYEGIKIIRKNTDMDNSEKVLQTYHKIMEQQLFETPVGLGYLRELQEYLMMLPFLRNDTIRPIELDDFFPPEQEERQPAEKKENGKGTRKASKAAARPSRSNKKLRGQLKTSIIINIVLVLIVAGMFVITLTGSSPTILNYENKLVDKYAKWEEELSEREQQVREREQAVNQEQ